MNTKHPLSEFDRAELRGLVEEVSSGRRKLHDLPAELSASQSASVRREWLQQHAGISLQNIGCSTMDLDAARCENLIGAIQVPVGVVGPLHVHGEFVSADEQIYAPLATTEGALIASVARGCRALRDSGGRSGAGRRCGHDPGAGVSFEWHRAKPSIPRLGPRS